MRRGPAYPVLKRRKQAQRVYVTQDHTTRASEWTHAAHRSRTYPPAIVGVGEEEPEAEKRGRTVGVLMKVWLE